MTNNWLVRLANRLRSKSRRFASGNRIASLNDLKGVARDYDELARAQYVAGVLGDNLSVVRNPRRYLADPSTVSRLLGTGATQRIVDEWTSRSGKDFLGQAANAVYGVLGGSSERDIAPEDVLQSIVTGISPITGGPLFGGNPLPYKFGQDANGTVFPIGSTANMIGERAGSVANDVRSHYQSRRDVSGDIELFPTDNSGIRETMMDTLEQELYEGSGTMTDLLFERGNLALISDCVRRKISNELTREIWDVIVATDGDVLKPGKGGVGIAVKPIETADQFQRMFGRSMDPNSIGRNFRANGEEVMAAIAECFASDSAVDRIRFHQELEEFLHEERTKHRSWRGRAANRRNRYSAVENVKEPLKIRLKDGTQLPPITLIRGYMDGIEMARKDKDVVAQYGTDLKGNPVEVMDWLYTMLGYWEAHALSAEKKGIEYMLTRKQKEQLNKGLRGTKGILGPYIRTALRYHCMRDGMCDLGTLPKEDEKFQILANRFASIRKRYSR